MNYTYIENTVELEALLKDYEDRRHHTVALDIEAESNLHVYGERLCLIQMFDGVRQIIVDPFRIDNDALKALFENRQILKVVYDAPGDMALLKNTVNIEMKFVLDLRPAVDILNYSHQDLHSVIASELGISLAGKSKFQKYNWMNRPLSAEALDYALNDVAHLFRLKDAILEKLCMSKLFDRFMLRNLQIQNKDYLRNPEDKYRKMGGYASLSQEQRTAFRRVFDIRDRYAKRLNIPPDYVIKKRDLVGMVKDPGTIDRIRLPERFGASIQDIRNELSAVIRP